jgi:hypothetical protein
MLLAVPQRVFQGSVKATGSGKAINKSRANGTFEANIIVRSFVLEELFW